MINFDSKYGIVSLSINKASNNKDMVKLQLKDFETQETYNCVMWEEAILNTDKKTLKTGNIVSVKGFDFNEKFKNYTLKELILLEEGRIGLNESERQILFNNILEVLSGFSDKELSSAIFSLIKENEELFKISPAAEKIHHNYIGGLMQHIWECVQIAKANFPVVFKEINHDLVFAGCIAHDLGKMFEYIVDVETGMISRNKDFQKVWINHIQWGFNWANQNDFPELAHIIASHHGLREWNALVEPITPEANLVHQIDMISSRLGKISIECLISV
ncbi:MAG: HD domain-containing protein [Candidatus Gastranaerophilales bacterium]|nr:HD domain-containing protein [Candidatus Gastranaerophilales bacterium]